MCSGIADNGVGDLSCVISNMPQPRPLVLLQILTVALGYQKGCLHVLQINMNKEHFPKYSLGSENTWRVMWVFLALSTGWAGYAPPSGSEVFIGKIPQDIYEDKLIPLFQSVGRLYEFRLMMTFSGLNRGFAYAKYMNRQNAQEAIALLNNFQIQSGSPILVCRSTEKCELCIDGLALSLKECHLLPMLQELTPGLHSISLHASPFRKKRQLAEVKYISHQAAAIAKKNLVEGLFYVLP